jgi:hypothetical protein
VPVPDFSPGKRVFKPARTLYLAMTGLYRLRKNSLDEGDGPQPVRLNVKMNRLQPLRVLLRTEKQCPQGLKPSKILFFMYGLKPVPFTPFHSDEFFRSLFSPGENAPSCPINPYVFRDFDDSRTSRASPIRSHGSASGGPRTKVRGWPKIDERGGFSYMNL